MCTEEDQYLASSNLRGTEAIVAGLCKVALSCERLGLDDNLLLNGLSAPQIGELVLSINRTFDTQISDATILEHPTVRMIAARLQNIAGISTGTSPDRRTAEEPKR